MAPLSWLLRTDDLAVGSPHPQQAQFGVRSRVHWYIQGQKASASVPVPPTWMRPWQTSIGRRQQQTIDASSIYPHGLCCDSQMPSALTSLSLAQATRPKTCDTRSTPQETPKEGQRQPLVGQPPQQLSAGAGSPVSTFYPLGRRVRFIRPVGGGGSASSSSSSSSSSLPPVESTTLYLPMHLPPTPAPVIVVPSCRQKSQRCGRNKYFTLPTLSYQYFPPPLYPYTASVLSLPDLIIQPRLRVGT